MTSQLWRSFVFTALLSTLSLSLGQVGYAQSSTPPTLDSEEWAFLTLINNYRAHNGAGPLQVSVTMENSSHWMANDMATHSTTSHTDSLGRDPQTRMTSFGYPYYPWGENIAGGYADSASVFNAWVNSEDHRVNMVNPAFAVIGIGRSYSSSSRYGWYWTTDFGGVVDQTLTPSSGPAITSFTATPSAITAAQPVTLSWAVSGASAVSIDNGIGDVSGATSKAVSPSTTTTYTLTATNTGGTSVARVTATVNTALAGQIILPANTAIQPGQQVNFPVTLATPAAVGGVFITLASSNLSTVTVAPENIFIPPGSSAPSRSPIVNGMNVGSAIITATASGLAPATGVAQVGTGGGPISPITLPANTTVGLG
ncbi:MAG: CAP domain-containing protein, partial [Acidobacteriota bacterium]|nr:CAP domain-containing protein [Acidobacteriota bacterium]